jgi:hypothetical protein
MARGMRSAGTPPPAPAAGAPPSSSLKGEEATPPAIARWHAHARTNGGPIILPCGTRPNQTRPCRETPQPMVRTWPVRRRYQALVVPTAWRTVRAGSPPGFWPSSTNEDACDRRGPKTHDYLGGDVLCRFASPASPPAKAAALLLWPFHVLVLQCFANSVCFCFLFPPRRRHNSAITRVQATAATAASAKATALELHTTAPAQGRLTPTTSSSEFKTCAKDSPPQYPPTR